MNCKEGDLAIRIWAPVGAHIPAGSIVKCLEFIPYPTIAHGADGSTRKNINQWRVDWNGKIYGSHGYMLAIPDSELRPIHDPGEDAQDETLIWLPVPSVTKTPEHA